MSFFYKGDFQIKDSWEQKPSRTSNSRNKSRQTEKNKSLVNAGKNILNEPSTDLLDEEITKKVLKQFADEQSFGTNKNLTKGSNDVKLPPRQKPSSHTQTDLLTSMASRLKTIQGTCKNQREQIKQKVKIIQQLQQQNKFLKDFKQDSAGQYEKVKELADENSNLKVKIQEMESYLKKYGLKWVGNKPEGQLEAQKMKKDIKNNYNFRLPKEIDISTILKRVEDLNSGLHSQGMGTQVYKQNGIHKFRQTQALPIGFFANGIAIKGYKFFSYKSKESLQILGDLVDGYFPYVLKGKYPNGIFLKVVDKILQQYNGQSSSQGITTYESKQENDFKPPSKEQFLKKLPENIIKNGKIICIRGQIQKRLNGQNTLSSQDHDLLDRQDGVNIFKTEQIQKMKNNVLNSQDVCSLKIRNQIGDIYMLVLRRNKKMSEVYQWMNKVSKDDFVVMSNFPRRTYDYQQEENLEELGFFPNAALHLMKK